MGQKRNKTGVDFEKQICESNGLIHKSASPRIKWLGTGRTNFNKIASVNFNPSNFLPDLDKSRFDKYDAVDNDGNKYEIKKYDKSHIKDWTLLSEPIFKVSDRSSMSRVINLFGNGDYEVSKEVYNDFISGMIEIVGEDLINKITSTFNGIYLIDDFVSTSDLEFRWKINSGWKGYNRLSIEFKIK